MSFHFVGAIRHGLPNRVGEENARLLKKLWSAVSQSRLLVEAHNRWCVCEVCSGRLKLNRWRLKVRSCPYQTMHHLYILLCRGASRYFLMPMYTVFIALWRIMGTA